jgi:hypothetical protein
VHAQAIGTVGRDRHLDDGIVEADHAREGHANRRVGGQLDDALVLVAQAHLAHGDEHAVRLLAADDALLEIDAGAGDVHSRGRKHALHAGARIGRAADDLDDLVTGIDEADAELVGVRVPARLLHIGDGEGGQILRAILDALDLEAEHGEARGDGLDIG